MLSISFCNISKKEEKEVHAIAGVDDAAIVGLIVTGTCLILGTYGYLEKNNDKSAVESFKDAFSLETYNNLYNYIKSVDVDDCINSLEKLTIDNPKLAAAATKVKAQYKYAIEKVSDSVYRTIDTVGSIVEFNSLSDASSYVLSTGMSYYMVKTLDISSLPINTSGNAVLNESVINDLKGAVSTLVKKTVTVGKNVLDWAVDKYKATAGVALSDDISAFSALQESSRDNFLSIYKDKSAIFFNDGYCKYSSSDIVNAFAFEGVLLELRLLDGSRLYSSMSVESFNTLNESYSNSGNISVFTNIMSSKYSLCNSSRCSAGISNYSYIGYNNNYAPYIAITCVNGVTSFEYLTYTYRNDVTNPWSYYSLFYKTTPLEGGTATIINSGVTGNYIIGDIAADGTINYSIYGETSESSYIDGLDTGAVSIKVNGDVEVSDKILQSVINNTATVSEVNDGIADINDSVKVIDTTVSTGFNSIKDVLTNIKDGVSGITSSIANFFLTLFGWLSQILDAIKAVPADIVIGLKSVEDAIAGVLPSDFVGTLEDIKNGVLSIPAGVIDSLEGIKDVVLAIPADIVTGIGDLKDVVLDIPDVTDVLSGIKNGVLDIPGNILGGLKNLLLSLFVPSDTYFTTWNNNFDNLLKDKLPYTVYNDFFNNIKEITRSRLEDVTITFYGKKCTILSFSWYYNNEDTINDWIRGVMFFVLVFYNINQMYKLIRGTSLYKVEKYIE